MRWLITGGCGFLGSSFIQKLVSEEGHAIRVLDNLSVGSRTDLAETTNFVEIELSNDLRVPAEGDCQLIVGDIRDAVTTEKASSDMDVIVHFAANTGVPMSVANPRIDMESNVIGTFNMLEAARKNGVSRFVFASSGAPAGEVEPPIHEELPPHPVSPYGASKLAGEGYCSAYYRTFGVETVALRFGNVYGPGSTHKYSVVAKFIKQAVKGKPLEIYGDGGQTRDFIFVDDLIDAVVKAATVPGIGGETFQIASNKETTIAELVEMMLQILEKAGINKPIVKHEDKRLGDVMRNYSDTTKAKEVLGWAPSQILEEGIAKTVEYFLCENENKLL